MKSLSNFSIFSINQYSDYNSSSFSKRRRTYGSQKEMSICILQDQTVSDIDQEMISILEEHNHSSSQSISSNSSSVSLELSKEKQCSSLSHNATKKFKTEDNGQTNILNDMPHMKKNNNTIYKKENDSVLSLPKLLRSNNTDSYYHYDDWTVEIKTYFHQIDEYPLTTE
ncbi:hypothetical protein WA158_002143 [Blastocystis sp. Blastoise]